MNVHSGDNKLEANDCCDKNKADQIALRFKVKELPAIDKHGAIKTGDRLGDFFFRQLDFFRLFEIFGRDYKTLSARGALGTLATVFIIEADHRVAIGTVELDSHEKAKFKIVNCKIK